MPRPNRKEIQRLELDLESLQEWVSRLPIQIGNSYLNTFLDSFKRGGFIDNTFERWKPRKKNRGRKRAILVKSGRLRRSIKMSIKGTQIVFSSSVPYAEIHNEGGTITGTARVKGHTRSRGGKRHKVRGHRRKMNIKIPKRQFMGRSAFAERRVIKNLEYELSKLFDR